MEMESFKTSPKKPKEIPQRLWIANEVNLKLMVKDIKVVGKENIKEIPPGAKVVIITTHLTDLDIPISIHAVARDLNVVVMNQSTHHKFWGPQGEKPTNIGLRIAGKHNFIPIDFQRNEETGKKSPEAFNPNNFEPAVKSLEEGRAVMIVAHNPSQELGQNLEDIKGGYGGVYLALLTDSYVLPVNVTLDRKTGMYDPNLIKTLKELDKPNASVDIGKPFKLEKVVGMEHFSELMKKRKSGTMLTKEERTEFSRLADALREKSQEVMKRLSDKSLKKN